MAAFLVPAAVGVAGALAIKQVVTVDPLAQAAGTFNTRVEDSTRYLPDYWRNRIQEHVVDDANDSQYNNITSYVMVNHSGLKMPTDVNHAQPNRHMGFTRVTPGGDVVTNQMINRAVLAVATQPESRVFKRVYRKPRNTKRAPENV